MSEKTRQGTLPSGRKYKAVRKSGGSVTHTSIVSEHKAGAGTFRTHRDSLKTTAPSGATGTKTTKMKHETGGYVTKIRSGTLPSGQKYNANREGPKKFNASVGDNYRTVNKGPFGGKPVKKDVVSKSGKTPSGKSYKASRSTYSQGGQTFHKSSHVTVSTPVTSRTVAEAHKDKASGQRQTKSIHMRNRSTGMLSKARQDVTGKKKLDESGTRLVSKKSGGK